MFARAVNQGKLAVADQLLADDCVCYTPAPTQQPAKDGEAPTELSPHRACLPRCGWDDKNECHHPLGRLLRSVYGGGAPD